METTKIYEKEFTLVSGDKLTVGNKREFDLEMRTYANLIVEIKIRKIEERPF